MAAADFEESTITEYLKTQGINAIELSPIDDLIDALAEGRIDVTLPNHPLGRWRDVHDYSTKEDFQEWCAYQLRSMNLQQ